MYVIILTEDRIFSLGFDGDPGKEVNPDLRQQFL